MSIEYLEIFCNIIFILQVRITIHEDNDNPPVLSQSSFVYTITNDSLPDLTFGSFSSTDIDIKEEHQIVTYTTSSRYCTCLLERGLLAQSVISKNKNLQQQQQQQHLQQSQQNTNNNNKKTQEKQQQKQTNNQ
jgi:hypothetical protein